MIKSMFKRAWLSIIRKPGKSVVMLLIMFVMANLVLSSISIGNSVEESTAYAKTLLGSEVYLSPVMNFDRDSSSMGEMGEMESGGGSSDRGQRVEISRTGINVSLALGIGESSYLKDMSYSVSGSANAVDFTAVESDTSSSTGKGQMMGGMTDRVVSDFVINGVNSYAFIDEVSNNTMQIVEGDYFDEDSFESLIISYELATENDFEVGDVIHLQNTESEEEFEFTIIGIFATDDSGYDNMIYMNIDEASKFISSNQYNDGDYYVSNVVYYLNTADDADLFIIDANDRYPDLADQSLELDIDTAAYDTMAGPIESVGSFANLILIIVVGATVLIITLVITNNIKDRQYEMGVLMSLGCDKIYVIGQIFSEIVIVSTLGFILSMGTSYYVSSMLSESVLENQLTTTETISENNYGRPTGNMTGGMSMPGQSSTTSDVDVIDELEISVSVTDYLTVFGIGYLIAFIAMLLPAISIMKYEPKTILTGRN